VVIPTFNEAANLLHAFALLPEDVFEVIVVDGRSTDGTIESPATSSTAATGRATSTPGGTAPASCAP